MGLETAAASAVVGFAYTGSWRAKAAYDTTAESTIYLRAEVAGRGIGRALYRALFAALEGADLHAVVAGITLPNPASIVLHRGFGFVSVGVFREVGRKFGRFHDVEWFRRSGPAAGS
jgi:phosphinothricin acetyltransferase